MEKNDNSPIRLLLFSSQQKVNPLYQALAHELNYTLEVRQAFPAEALEIMQTLPRDYCDVVLCRGFTYEQLKGKFETPIVNIKTTPLDVLQTLSNCKDSKKNIVIVLNKDEYIQKKLIETILNISLRIHYCETKEDLIHALNSSVEYSGTTMIVGRVWCINYAQQIGIKSLLLCESDYSLRNVLHEALQIAYIRREARQRHARMEAVLNTLDEGFFLLDDVGIIKSLNQTAATYLSKKAEDVIGQYGYDVFPESRVRFVLETGRPVRDHLSSSDNKPVLWNNLPVILDGKPAGVLCHFSEAHKVLESGGRVRSGLRSKNFAARYSFSDIITQNPYVEELKTKAKIYASSNSSVLITGESGTGKELFAQSIHLASARAKQPFVAVNCAALPESLLESELFGYEEGAFTGAKRQGKPGLFELAHCGTFFLDEVAEMSLTVQARLLRVLQEKEIVRVGGSQVIPVQVRIVCATNQSLKQLVAQRTFRDDLYYRLSVLTLCLPPLRERPEDICAVGIPFLLALLTDPPQRDTLEKELGPLLCQYPWPGNFRELQSTMERLALIANHQPNRSWSELLQQVHMDNPRVEQAHPQIQTTKNTQGMLPLKDVLREHEHDIINQRLAHFEQDMQRTARSLKISRMTLWRKLNEYQN